MKHTPVYLIFEKEHCHLLKDHRSNSLTASFSIFKLPKRTMETTSENKSDQITTHLDNQEERDNQNLFLSNFSKATHFVAEELGFKVIRRHVLFIILLINTFGLSRCGLAVNINIPWVEGCKIHRNYHYDVGKFDCELCAKGHFSMGSKSFCYECSESCGSCDQVTGECKDCKKGYFLDESSTFKKTCASCVPNCSTCGALEQCSSCFSGYYLDKRLNRCIECTVDHCDMCSGESLCEICKPGYSLSYKYSWRHDSSENSSHFVYECSTKNDRFLLFILIYIVMAIFVVILIFSPKNKEQKKNVSEDDVQNNQTKIES